MNAHYLCTYCDQGYAARMLCLFDSLKRQGEAFRLFVLCFDAATEAVVRAEGDAALVAVPLAELLAADPGFAAVRAQRSPVEFFFTSTPCVVRHCLRLAPEAERLTYLDADLYFFRPASAVFAEQGGASVGIVPHRFPPRLRSNLEHGTYNVGWVSFRRDRDGLACLDWWRERCLEWCHDRVDNGRYADQGYLDEFPRRFSGVKSMEHAGINAAPWNVGIAPVRPGEGGPWLGDVPVLFYHFQGLREVSPGWFDMNVRRFGVKITRALTGELYLPYLRGLARRQAELAARHGIRPSLGYKRLPEDGSLRSRWERFKARRVWPAYRRALGEVVRCDAEGR